VDEELEEEDAPPPPPPPAPLLDFAEDVEEVVEPEDDEAVLDDASLWLPPLSMRSCWQA